MKNVLDEIEQRFKSALESVKDIAQLEDLRVEFFGRKGHLPAVLKGLKDLSESERKEMGQYANQVKKNIETAFESVQKEIANIARQSTWQAEKIDITEPGIEPEAGHLHLVTQGIQEIEDIFKEIGFTRARHPEVDWDYYAFESLNIPKGHPARDEWETFFVSDGDKVAESKMGKMILTPHTSNAQVRQMELQKPPIRMMNINKTYRRQSGIRHSSMFHQFEGLFIDEGITLADLKGVIDHFVKSFYGPDRTFRLRPHHFKFTEPSFEVDISAEAGREGEKLFKAGWLELGGAGMVHPNVIKAGGLDPEKYTGFAFGWGIERMMMTKSGINIPDIRLMYKNDLRFLKQF